MWGLQIDWAPSEPTKALIKGILWRLDRSIAGDINRCISFESVVLLP